METQCLRTSCKAKAFPRVNPDSSFATSTVRPQDLGWIPFSPQASVSPYVQWGVDLEAFQKFLLQKSATGWFIPDTKKFPSQSPNSSRDLVIPGFELSRKKHLKNSPSLKKKKAVKRK
jgi:hypothetical protein